MTNDTWLDYGTAFEKQRRQLEATIKAAADLKIAYDTAVKALAELQEKHQNLRAAEKERRMGPFKHLFKPKKRQRH